MPASPTRVRRPFLGRLTGAFGRWLGVRPPGVRHRILPWPLALAAVVVLHAAAVPSLLGLSLNNAPEVYFAADAPSVRLRDALRRDFPSDEALTVLLQGDDLYTPDVLRRLDRAVAALEEHPLVDRVAAITSQERISGSSEGFSVEPLVDVSRLDHTTLESIKRRVMSDRFAPGLLASRDGRYLALAVRPKPLDESGERLELKVAVASALRDAGLHQHFAGDAGPVTLDVAQLTAIYRDTITLVPLTVAVGLALLWWVIGRLRPVVIGGVAMSTVVLPTVAGIVAFGQPYTMATAILPSLLAAYTVATLLHLYAGVQQAQGHSSSRTAAIDRAIAETRRPSAFNVLTTGAGLLSLLLVPIPPVQSFGAAGAAGTLLVFLTVYVLVPPFLRSWDDGKWPQHRSGMSGLGALAKRLALLSMRRPKTILTTLAFTAIAAFPLVQMVQIETDLLAFFAPQHPVNVDSRRIEAALAGVTTLEIDLRGAAPDTFQRVDTLRELKRFQKALEALPQVDRTVSMVDLVEEMHWAMNREQPAFRTVPPSDRLLRQYLLVYDGNDLWELVNRDFDHSRMVLNLSVHGTREIGPTIDTIKTIVAGAPIPGVKVDIGGYGRLLVDQVGLLVEGQTRSFGGAFAQIFLLMMLLLRSVRGAAVCMAPNLAPLYFVFVLMGAAGIPLNSATVMIASVVLGITIDDTIHLYHGYRKRLQAGASPLFAVARSYESTGRAVLATSAVLIAQFALLTTSDFIPTANFGLMTAVGLLSGLLFEVLLLPALLVLTAGLPGTSQAASARRRTSPRTTDSAARPTEQMVESGTGKATSATASPPACMVTPTARRVLVCHGDGCKRAGAARVWRRLRDEQQTLRAAALGQVVQLTKTSCLGPCRFAPVVQVFPEGTYYGLLDGPPLERVIKEHLVNGREVPKLALPAPSSSTLGA